MTSKDSAGLARRVITGHDSAGRSVIAQDAEVATWVRRPTGSLIMDVWGSSSLPVSAVADPVDADELVLLPEPHGIRVRMAVFPPDASIDAEARAAYEASLAQVYGDQGEQGHSVPGMHRTETIDIVTVVDGELWMVLDDGETCLRAGDTLIQRGTRHAWQNRSDKPCTISTVMVRATDLP